MAVAAGREYADVSMNVWYIKRRVISDSDYVLVAVVLSEILTFGFSLIFIWRVYRSLEFKSQLLYFPWTWDLFIAHYSPTPLL